MEHLIEDSVEKKYSIILIVLGSIEEIAKNIRHQKKKEKILEYYLKESRYTQGSRFKRIYSFFKRNIQGKSKLVRQFYEALRTQAFELEINGDQDKTMRIEKC
jgi:hypothetical protein